MIMCSVLSKVLRHWSPACWLLCRTGLTYYLHPTDDQLRKDTAKKKSSSKHPEELEATFIVQPKNIDTNLQKVPVTEADILQLRFFSDFQWLVDFGVCSTIVYIITEVYLYKNPVRDEINLSIVWCLLLLLFTLKSLLSVTMMYFKSSASDGEKALVVLALFCYLLLAMMVLVVSEDRLELGLDEAYVSFNVSAREFLAAQKVTSVGILSKMGCKGIIAIICAITGACLAFPGLRLGKMHSDAVKLHSSRRAVQLLLHAAFLAPGLATLLWVKPLARHYLVAHTWPSYDKPLLSSECFAVLRVVLVLLACLLRLLVLPTYLQTYLEMARERLERQRISAGKITNKDIQRLVAGVFYYLCVVALQCILPLLLCFTLSLMFKTLGGLHWASLGSPRSFVSEECSIDEGATLGDTLGPESSLEASHVVTTGLDSIRKVFSTELWRGLLGFWVWWSTFVWFISGLVGVVYQRYFNVG